MKRRHFLHTAAATSLAGPSLALASSGISPQTLGKAEHCIMIWLGGGMAQIDTFDPKRLGDAKGKKAGSYYTAIDTAVPGVQVCQHLPRLARQMEQVTALRTVHHDTVDEHAAATNRMHTGRLVSGTVQYPSLGSIVAAKRGAAAENVPAYVVIGFPNLTRGPGFLGQEAGYVYLTDIEAGPAGLARPEFVTTERQSRREALLQSVRETGAERFGDDALFQSYNTAIGESLRLSGPDFMRVFDLSGEPAKIRNAYGSDFGQRCLLARRLSEEGVRFIEISHNMNFQNGTGWDTHRGGQLNQHLLIQDIDQSISALMQDLEARGRLDKTLIIINTEFGRPAQFDAGGGRGHHSQCFSVVLAGGGLNHCGGYGVSDENAMKALENPLGVPDFFATALAAIQIDPSQNLYDGDRPVPITDGGRAIEQLLG